MTTPWTAGHPNEFACLPASPTSLDDVEDVDYRGCDIDGDASVDPLLPGNCGDDDDLADNLCQHYVFPNIRSGRGIVAATIIDDETADLITIESGTDTVVQKCGDDLCTIPDPAGDTFQIRLTKRPEVLDDDEHASHRSR